VGHTVRLTSLGCFRCCSHDEYTEKDDNLQRRVCNADEHLATSDDPLSARVRDAFVHQLASIVIGDYRQTGTRVLAEEIHELAPAYDD
jgi:hypothetical protein